MINPYIDLLSKVCADLSDEEIESAIMEIYSSMASGKKVSNGKFDMVCNKIIKSGVPADYNMIEHGILLEAARRWVNDKNR